MTLEIKNKDLLGVYQFLSSLTLPRKVARSVSNLTTQIQVKINELVESEKELVESFGGTVSEGKINLPDDSQADFSKEHDDLLEETVIFNNSYKEQFSIMKSYFMDWNGEVQPQLAKGMNAFYDAIEELSDEGE